MVSWAFSLSSECIWSVGGGYVVSFSTVCNAEVVGIWPVSIWTGFDTAELEWLTVTAVAHAIARSILC